MTLKRVGHDSINFCTAAEQLFVSERLLKGRKLVQA